MEIKIIEEIPQTTHVVIIVTYTTGDMAVYYRNHDEKRWYSNKEDL